MARNIRPGRPARLSNRTLYRWVSGGSGGGGGGSAAFKSAWAGSTGSSDIICRDNGIWTSIDYNTNTLSVISSSGLGFPAGLTNVLRVNYDNVNGHFAQLHTTSAAITAPAVGKYCYYRWFFRVVAANGTAFGQCHPWHNGDAPLYISWNNGTISGSQTFDWDMRIQSGGGGGTYPYDRTYMNGNASPGAACSHTYYHEFCLQRTASTTMKFRCRTGDVDGSNLVTSASGYTYDGNTWETGNPDITCADDCFTNLVLGNNDVGAAISGDIYFGALYVRYSDSSTDWIGVSQQADETW